MISAVAAGRRQLQRHPYEDENDQPDTDHVSEIPGSDVASTRSLRSVRGESRLSSAVSFVWTGQFWRSARYLLYSASCSSSPLVTVLRCPTF